MKTESQEATLKTNSPFTKLVARFTTMTALPSNLLCAAVLG